MRHYFSNWSGGLYTALVLVASEHMLDEENTLGFLVRVIVPVGDDERPRAEIAARLTARFTEAHMGLSTTKDEE